MAEYKDGDADKHDDGLWVVDRSGLGLDLIKRKHFSLTHSGNGGGRNKNLSTTSRCSCTADHNHYSSPVTHGHTLSLSVAYHNEHLCRVLTEITSLKLVENTETVIPSPAKKIKVRNLLY